MSGLLIVRGDEHNVPFTNFAFGYTLGRRHGRILTSPTPEELREALLDADSFFFYGHGDRDPKQIEAVVEAGEEIIRRCVALGGSVTGEHGVGVEKSDLLPLMFAPEDLELQVMARRIFNQGELCNPCKVIPTDKSCVEHKRRWRGVAW